MSNTTEKKVHQGRKVKRFREMLGLKQEGLAMELGEDWTQRRVSLLEGKEEIEPALLEQVAKALKVPSEAIKNLDDDGAVQAIANTFNDSAFVYNNNGTLNINPVEKWLEALDENKRLYERLLLAEKEKVALLEKLLEVKK